MAPLVLLALAAAGGYALIKSQEGKKPGGGGASFQGSYDANLPPEAARAVDIAIGRGGVPGETDVARLRQFAATLAQYPIAQGAVTTYANAIAAGGAGAGMPYVPGYTPGTPATPNTGFGGGGGAPGNTGIFGGLGGGLGGAPGGPTPTPAAGSFPYGSSPGLPPGLPALGGTGGGGGASQQGPGSPPGGSLGDLLGSIGLALPGVPATPTPAPAGGTLGQQVGIALGGLGGMLGGLAGGARKPFPPVVNNVRTAQQALAAWNDRTGSGADFGKLPNDIDGQAGPRTRAATAAFQRWSTAHGSPLAVDSTLGPRTYAALQAYGKANP